MTIKEAVQTQKMVGGYVVVKDGVYEVYLDLEVAKEDGWTLVVIK